MKKAVKIISLIVAPAVLACGLFAGCKSCKGKKVNMENKSIMQDIDVFPAVTADYEQYSVQAYNVFACTCGPGCQYCRSGDQYHYFYAGGDNYGKANGSKIQ